MCDVIAHRGPDDEGYYISDDGRLGLGMRRLSIIDLQGGKQPFFNESKTIACVCNGEIYNFGTLRKKLQRKGHNFRSQSDCEVIVHAYAEYGDAFIRHVEGMFGLALYDSAKQRLVLIRDRFGIKPLYYYINSQGIIFGSEIKSILTFSGIERRINLQALQQYLWNVSVPEPYTLFEGIRKLPPAYMLFYDLKRLEHRLVRYWRLPIGQSKTTKITTDDMRSALRNSVKLHLQSDVPVGILLSGGVDSSAITAMAAKLYKGKLHTFSVAFDTPGYSEFEYSRQVAKLYGTAHHEVILDADKYWEIVKKVIRNMDEPICDPAMPAMYCICNYAREYVKALLSGEGADEVFGGYAGRLNGAAKRMGLTGRLTYLARSKGKGSKWHRLIKSLRELPQAMALPGPIWMLRVERLGWAEEALARLMGKLNFPRKRKPWLDWMEDPEMRDRWECDAPLLMDRLLYLDANVNLPATLLMKADKMSMAASIELRVPFLGDEFVRYAAALPVSAKVDGLNGKALLKKAMEGYLPHELLYRRKRGWPVPIGAWLRKNLKNIGEHYLFDSIDGLTDLFPKDVIRQYWNLHQAGKRELGPQLWQLVLLSLWRKRFAVG